MIAETTIRFRAWRQGLRAPDPREMAMRVGLALLLAVIVAPAAQAEPRRDLVIGISQFPSNLHPNIDTMAAKSLIEGMTMRPFTAFDGNWRLVCYLCTDLPTLENGEAVRETTPDGKNGVALTFTIREGAIWG